MSELRKMKRNVEKSKGLFVPMKCCGRHMEFKTEKTETKNDQGVVTGHLIRSYWICKHCGKTRSA